MLLRAPQMFNSKWSSASAVVVEIPGAMYQNFREK
jgi:hypothetical protein